MRRRKHDMSSERTSTRAGAHESGNNRSGSANDGPYVLRGREKEGRKAGKGNRSEEGWRMGQSGKIVFADDGAAKQVPATANPPPASAAHPRHVEIEETEHDVLAGVGAGDRGRLSGRQQRNRKERVR